MDRVETLLDHRSSHKKSKSKKQQGSLTLPDKSKKNHKKDKHSSRKHSPLPAISQPPIESRSDENMSEDESGQFGQSFPTFPAPRRVRVEEESDEDGEAEEAHTISMEEEENSNSAPSRGEMDEPSARREEHQQAQQARRTAATIGGRSVMLNDDEMFKLDDDIVRRIIYKSCRQVSFDECKANARIVTLNFTTRCFEPGAVKWEQLKDVYYEIFTSFFNSLAFATGKKIKLTPSDKEVEKQANGPANGRGNTRRRGGDDDGDTMDVPVQTMSSTPEAEINNFLKGDKAITVFLETLVTGNKVSGYRWWIFDRVDTKTENDSLSLGLRESLLEAAKIQVQATKEMQAITKANNTARSARLKKSQTAKQYAVTKEFSFSHYTTFDSHFTGLLNRYFTQDECLSLVAEANPNRTRQFRDTRSFKEYDTLLRKQDPTTADYMKERHPCNLSRLFAKETGMFYYVNQENVNEAQCRLESYFDNANGGRVTVNEQTAHTRADLLGGNFKPADRHNNNNEMDDGDEPRPTPKLVDVADHGTAAKDSDFASFPYENITYHLDNTFLSYEFMSRMPLPHRIGTILYTHKDQIALKRAAGLIVTHTEAAEEEVENFNIDDLSRVVGNIQLNDEIEEKSGDEIFAYSAQEEKTLQFGPIVRYMGLHQTEPEITSDIMLSRLHHVDSVSQTYIKLAIIPKDVIDKFLASMRNEIYARLRIILNHLTPKNRAVVAETMAAINKAQEDTRNKSLSSMMLTPRAGAIGDGRDQASHMLDQITHSTILAEDDPNLLQLPYISFSLRGAVKNANKTKQIIRKAEQIKKRRAIASGILESEEDRLAQEIHEDKDYQAKVASGNPAYFKEEIEKYRPYGNSMHVLKTQLPTLTVEETFLTRDIDLRLEQNNGPAWAKLHGLYFDPATGEVPPEKEAAYANAIRKFRDAVAVECLNEFKYNPNVSFAGEGIRSDMMKRKVAYIPPSLGSSATDSNAPLLNEQPLFGTELPIHDARQELRPFGEFKTHVQALFADQFSIAYNYKIMWIVYIAAKHHCRWHPFCNSPKLNIILGGNGMVGKSHILQCVKRILPTGVGDMVTHITDQAFNVNRNMNDMLLIYEEMQNKYFGYSGGKNSSDGGGGGGTSAGSDSDTTNFFKARLTSGATSTMSWFENEETGMRDMKISKAHCQGNLLCASNNCFTDADANVMTRFILLTVPKCKSRYAGENPQDKNKHIFGTDSAEDRAVLDQHAEYHRVYFIMERMVKARVMDDNIYGVNCDGGRIMRDLVLDHLQKKYGISTNDVRKRDYILEFARCSTLLYAVWMGLTSEMTRHLFYDPHDPTKYIGFNVRVITEGIMPFMVVTKDQIIDAITSLSSLWYHDYQDTILEAFTTKHCRLNELRSSDFLVRSKTQAHYVNLNASNNSVKSKARSSLVTSGAYGNAFSEAQISGAGQQQQDAEIDYNYIVVRGKTREVICQKLSGSTGDVVISVNDISKLLHDLSKCQMENIDGYQLSMVPSAWDEEGKVIGTRPKLVRASGKTMSRAIVEWSSCPQTGEVICALLIHFPKQKLPAVHPNRIIQNLNKTNRSLLPTPDQIASDAPLNAPDREDDEDDAAEYGGGPIAGGDMEVESPEDVFERKVRSIGRVNVENDTLFYKAFRDIFQNNEFENPGMPAEELEALRDSIRNPVTGEVPTDFFITADAPKQKNTTYFYPELKDDLDKIDDGDAPIRFVDELNLLQLKQDPLGKKIIVRNHNTASVSTRLTSSIHKPRHRQLVTRTLEDGTEVVELGAGEVLKKARIEQYNKVDAWSCGQDLDAIIVREHNLNMGFTGLSSKPNYPMINYPLSTYMALHEDKFEKGGVDNTLIEYPYVSNMVRIAGRKRDALGLIKPESVTYPDFGEFMDSNRSKYGATRSDKGKNLFIGKIRPERCLETERENRKALLDQYVL